MTIDIYIYIYRERERKREIDIVTLYIYICIYNLSITNLHISANLSSRFSLGATRVLLAASQSIVAV